MWISELGLSPKAYDAIKRCGVKTIDDLMNLPKARLMAQPKVGRMTVFKIEQALRRHGFEWTDKVADEPPITIRDKFAMAAITVANGDAERAYEIADAMMAERKR